MYTVFLSLVLWKVLTGDVRIIIQNYKLQDVKYTEKRENRNAKRHFGPPLTEKMIKTWRDQDILKKTVQRETQKRGKRSKWLEVESEMLKSKNGIAISTKMIRTYAVKTTC